MAITKVWPIKTKLKHSINYIIDPSKTANKDYGKDNNYHYLHSDKINYKNEKCEYVSGINCLAHTAYQDMELTKQSYFKEKGVLAFHGCQSFKEGEVTPELAHEIGVRLVEELFGKRFEVIVATHQNTNCIHNHFIVNSVSFKDGKKYNNNKENYALVREVSDSLCEEYGLSTLDGWHHGRFTKHKYFYQQKVLNDDYYKFVKEDIDTAIKETVAFKQFLDRLKYFGYECHYANNKLTVWKDGYDKIRLERAFGKEYSCESIKNRFEYTREQGYKRIYPNQIYNDFAIKNNSPKGIYGLYLYYCYLFKIFPKEYPNQRLPYSIRKDVKEMDNISNQIIFMTKNKIETYDELINYKRSNEAELSDLKFDKANLRKRYNRAKSEDVKVKINNEIIDLEVKIKELSKTKKYCTEIEARSTTIQNNVVEFHNSDLAKEKSIAR